MVQFIRNREELEQKIITMHAQGRSIRALARYFEMGRNTVRKIIRKNRWQREQGHDILSETRPKWRKSKLDPHIGLMKDLLEQYPDITGVRMLEELR